MIINSAAIAYPEFNSVTFSDHGPCWKVEASRQAERVPSILVADPNAANLRLVTNIIEDEGFKVVTAREGREARHILQSAQQFAAAIFEVVIPHFSGPDLVRYMRREERFKDVPVLMMTRTSNTRLSWESFAAGAAVLMPEPFSISQLQNLLHMLVDNGPRWKLTEH